MDRETMELLKQKVLQYENTENDISLIQEKIKDISRLKNINNYYTNMIFNIEDRNGNGAMPSAPFIRPSQINDVETRMLIDKTINGFVDDINNLLNQCIIQLQEKQNSLSVDE